MKKLLCLICFLLIIPNLVHARFGTYEDAPSEIELYDRDINVNEDGTWDSTIEIKAKILKESARSDFVNYRLNYNGDSSSVEILSAKTINGEKEFVVTKDMIEDKPIAAIGYGFDEQRQILISYPNLQIGSKIYLKYRINEKKVALEEVFADNLFFQGYATSSKINISSKIPLYIKVNDPRNCLKIEKDKEAKFYNAKITLTKPLYEGLLNEPHNGVLDLNNITWVSISSLNNWKDLSTKLSDGYHEIINQKLPQLLIEISKASKSKQSDVDIINTTTSLLNDKVQYMGDWRSVKGRFFPRNLEQISSTQVGDCKDFTAITAAILQNIGFKVLPALVMRGERAQSMTPWLPSLGHFNHVILKVIGRDRQVYWIDPTNIESMAIGIFPDIAGKMALVLDGEKSIYEKIPDIDYTQAQCILNQTIQIQGESKVEVVGDVLLKKELALRFAGLGLYYSEKQIEDIFFNSLLGKPLAKNNKKQLILPDLKSRILNDLHFKYEYNQDNVLFKTNLGYGFKLNLVLDLTSSTPDQVTDLFIGYPHSIHKSLYINDVKVENVENLNCDINTPWVSIKRHLLQKDNGVHIEDKISILRSFITSAELKSEEYKMLKKFVEKNIEGSFIIFSK